MNIKLPKLSLRHSILSRIAAIRVEIGRIGRIGFATANQREQPMGKHGILDEYVRLAPSPQNALDIFADEWSSVLPPPYNHLGAGKAALFEDARIDWVADNIGGFAGRTVLELGPLEGGHTFMIENLGASSITSIESNTRAYLKCLIVKEILGLQRAHFLFGDFVEYLRQNDAEFDVGIASGVLYHMMNPVEVLELLSRKTDRLFVWTHYYDERIIRKSENLSKKFPSATLATQGGFAHTLYRQEYQSALDWKGFCGGNTPYSYWLSRDDVLGSLRYFGYESIKIGFDHPDHPNGPAFALLALRQL
jgi:hypothetical protein